MDTSETEPAPTLDDVTAKHPAWTITEQPYAYEALRRTLPHVERYIYAETLAELDDKLTRADQ
jgi:hypothetical protein